MKIIVCIKQVLDPEIPAKAFQVDPEAKRAIVTDAKQLVVSDYDKVAVEAALRIKESREAEVTVLSLGGNSALYAIRQCIAMGADAGILLSDPSFDDSDSYATAYLLAQAIKKIDDFDLIICGIQEGDWDAGQVGSGIAEFLGIASVTSAGKVDSEEGEITVERIVSDGRETVVFPLPALITVRSEVGEPRYPSTKRVRDAFRIEIPIWTAQDIAPVRSRNRILTLSVPTRAEAECKLIDGESPEERGENLALRLREAKVI